MISRPGKSFPRPAPTEPASESAAPLDLADLMERCLGHLELAERLLKSFESRFWPEVLQLEEALAAEDREQVSQVAHRLKGASANVSACALGQIMSLIEQASRCGRLHEVAQQLQRLPREWDNFTRFRASLSQAPPAGGQ